MPVRPRAAWTPFRPGPRGRIRIGLALLAVATQVMTPRGAAPEPVEPPPDASAPMVTLDALPLGVPLARLDEEARGRAEAVLGTSLFSQRVTGLRGRSREPVFRFLLDHPDFAAAVARALRLGK